MGIKELWDCLSPFCEEKPLYTLGGQVVAVDLACWILSAKTAVSGGMASHATPAQHLNNIFFRTSHLLSLNIVPVFILDGKAPALKANAIAARNAQQKMYIGDQSIEQIRSTNERKRFTMVLHQCSHMLRYMGLTCIVAKGEAETLCSFLSAQNLVGGVISQDSDCFAYGARVVYRNVSVTKNTCQVYDLKKISSDLRFSRNKFVVLALFLGCDYNDGGVKGVGKGQLLEFLSNIKDSEVLPRIRSWRSKPQFYEEYEMKMKSPHLYPMDELFRNRMKNELSIRAKALKDPNFPNEEIISEFLEHNEEIRGFSNKWEQPSLSAIMKFAKDRMNWNATYVLEKFLPLMTLWQLKNPEIISQKYVDASLRDLKGIVFPKRIIKKQTVKGVPCFKVQWEDRKRFFQHLYQNYQLDEVDESSWMTIENADLFEASHSQMVFAFEEGVVQKKLMKRPPTKKRQNLSSVRSALTNLNQNTETVKLPHPPPPLQIQLPAQVQKIDAFFPKKTNVAKLRADATKKHDFSFDLNCSGFSDGDDADISFIVDCIVSRPPPKITETVEQLDVKCSGSSMSNSPPRERDYNDLILESNQEFMRDQNEFIVSHNETNCDKFSSGDDTIQYEPDELELLNEIDQINCDRREDVKDELNDTFDLDKPYIPLMERIKKYS